MGECEHVCNSKQWHLHTYEGVREPERDVLAVGVRAEPGDNTGCDEDGYEDGLPE